MSSHQDNVLVMTSYEDNVLGIQKLNSDLAAARQRIAYLQHQEHGLHMDLNRASMHRDSLLTQLINLQGQIDRLNLELARALADAELLRSQFHHFRSSEAALAQVRQAQDITIGVLAQELEYVRMRRDAEAARADDAVASAQWRPMLALAPIRVVAEVEPAGKDGAAGSEPLESDAWEVASSRRSI